MSKPPQTETALAVESSDLLAFSRVIQHPFREGETRNVYEFPVTRKIVIEADPAVPESEVLALAKRCNDKELGMEIMGGGYHMKLSSDNVKGEPPLPENAVDIKE